MFRNIIFRAYPCEKKFNRSNWNKIVSRLITKQLNTKSKRFSNYLQTCSSQIIGLAIDCYYFHTGMFWKNIKLWGRFQYLLNFECILFLPNQFFCSKNIQLITFHCKNLNNYSEFELFYWIFLWTIEPWLNEYNHKYLNWPVRKLTHKNGNRHSPFEKIRDIDQMSITISIHFIRCRSRLL